MYGYRIIAAMLKHDGYRINRKRVKRRYGDAASSLRRASQPNEVWSYDFLEARTERGGKLRMLRGRPKS